MTITQRFSGVLSLALGAVPFASAQEMTLNDLGTSPYYEQEIYSDDESRAGPRFAPYDLDSFTDLRVILLFMDKGKYSASYPSSSGVTEYDGGFNTAYRISIMALHPLCGYAPINCFTPSTMKSDERPPAARLIGSRDKFDWLVGLEFFFANWEEDANTLGGAHTPEIQVRAIGADLHLFGLGIETKSPIPYLPGRISLEGTPFIGLGYAMAKFEDQALSISADDDGLYTEYGIRVALLGTYTWGLQIGLEARLLAANADVKLPFLSGTKFESTGFAYGGSLGWRF